MAIADKLTLLASSKEALRVKLGLPESLPFSEYYKYSYPFDPMTLFAGGKQGVWYDLSDKSTLFQDVAGTVPVTKDGDPVSKVLDKSGSNNHATQTVSAARPVYKDKPARLSLDKVDDTIIVNLPSRLVGTMTLASTTGTATYGVDIPAGNFTLGGSYFPSNNIVGLILREGGLSADDESKVDSYLLSKGAVKSFASNTSLRSAWRDFKFITTFPEIDALNITSFYAAWFGCSSLSSFPVLNLSSGVDFGYAWRDCSSLISFPLLNIPSSTSFLSAWQNCTSLQNFPSGFFDSVQKVNFTDVFSNTNLSTISIDNILVSIAKIVVMSGTRVFHQSGGSAPSTVGRAAIDKLRSEGWTVTVTGGY